MRQVELEDVSTLGKERNTIDDEYALVGLEDPQILMTTSHDPSQKLVSFVKEMRLAFPNSVRLNRGKLPRSELVHTARTHGFTDVMMFTETRGVPNGVTISHLPYGPTFYFTLYNVVTRHDIEDIGPMSEAYPHLVCDNFTTPLGKRVMHGLQSLFPVPRPDSARIVSFSNSEDFISFRNHTHRKNGKEVELAEAGPRFEMLLYEIRLGTVEMKEAETEWSLRPYFNSAKKRLLL
eukprot:gene9251-1661_t